MISELSMVSSRSKAQYRGVGYRRTAVAVRRAWDYDAVMRPDPYKQDSHAYGASRADWPRPPGHALVGVVFILLGIFIAAIGVLGVTWFLIDRSSFGHARLGTPLDFGLLLVVVGGICITFGRRMHRGGMR